MRTQECIQGDSYDIEILASTGTPRLKAHLGQNHPDGPTSTAHGGCHNIPSCKLIHKASACAIHKNGTVATERLWCQDLGVCSRLLRVNKSCWMDLRMGRSEIHGVWKFS